MPKQVIKNQRLRYGVTTCPVSPTPLNEFAVVRHPGDDTKADAAKSGGIYIVKQEGLGPIKLGFTTGFPKRLADLRQQSPYEIEPVFFGVFGETASLLEKCAHKLLRPWRMRGEWFGVDPFVAGIAIEAARDGDIRRRDFIALQAQIRDAASAQDYKLRSRLIDKSRSEFTDLNDQVDLPDRVVVGLGRRRIVLPPTKYTRLIVSGFPEIKWGAREMPSDLVARLALEEKSRARYARLNVAALSRALAANP